MANESAQVNTDTLASFLKLHKAEIVELAEKGVFVRGYHPDGRQMRDQFDFIKSIQSYVVYLHKKLDQDSLDARMKEEKTLLIKAQREKAQIELALMKNEVHMSEDVEGQLKDMLTRFRARLLNLPVNIGVMLLNVSGLQEAQAILKKAVLEVMAELRDYNPRDYHVKGHVGDRELSLDIVKSEIAK